MAFICPVNLVGLFLGCYRTRDLFYYRRSDDFSGLSILFSPQRRLHEYPSEEYLCIEANEKVQEKRRI